MDKRTTRAGVISHGNPLYCLAAIFLALGVAFICPSLSSADCRSYNGQATADQTLLATSAGTPSGQGRDLDPEMLEILRARKSALDQERAQIEGDLARTIRVGIEQDDPSSKRTKRAICKVNQDLETIIKRLAAHQQKRDAFERDWNACYVTLRDSAEVKSLQQKKQALDWDRTQIEKGLSELVRDHDRQIEQEKEIQWYQVALREIDQQLVGYRNNRDAFERDWEAFYNSAQK